MLIWPILLMASPATAAEIKPAMAPTEMLRLAVPVFEELEQGQNWQVVIEQRIIIRVPARRSTINNFSAPTPQSPTHRGSTIVWREKKGPKCVSMRDITGMQTTQRDSIDLLIRDNQRLRAQLNHGCRALDFYAGFYMAGNEDGRLCEGRDQLHARTGARCEVAKFRLMVPERRED